RLCNRLTCRKQRLELIKFTFTLQTIILICPVKSGVVEFSHIKKKRELWLKYLAWWVLKSCLLRQEVPDEKFVAESGLCSGISLLYPFFDFCGRATAALPGRSSLLVDEYSRSGGDAQGARRAGRKA
ncbi:MAG TPA: hypothetical protein PKN29_13440, partial [Candidatus Ozemobacteraceae bacterium]|nr:hypothetical protein [Candidatus Ozemobacteraceae bacterium]